MVSPLRGACRLTRWSYYEISGTVKLRRPPQQSWGGYRCTSTGEIRNTIEPLAFNQYSAGGTLQSVTLTLGSALWHQTSVTARATNPSSQIAGVVLFANDIHTDLNVGVNLPTSTSLLTATDRNTVACNETVSSVLPGNSIECSDSDGHFKGQVTFPLPTGGSITLNIDNEIAHAATLELTGSAMDDFLGNGLVNVDLFQQLEMSNPFCSAAGFDLSCAADWDSHWYGDLRVTYVDEATITLPVPTPATWFLVAIGLAGIGYARKQRNS